MYVVGSTPSHRARMTLEGQTGMGLQTEEEKAIQATVTGWESSCTLGEKKNVEAGYQGRSAQEGTKPADYAKS